MVLLLYMTPTIPDRRRANLQAVAQMFDVPRSTVADWVRRGCPFLVRGASNREWQFDLLDVARWRFAPATDPDYRFDPDTAPPRERRDWFDSEHRRRQLVERDRQLIPAQDVRDGVAALVAVVSDVLAALPARLEADAGLSGPALDRARRAMDAALVELQTTAATLPRQ